MDQKKLNQKQLARKRRVRAKIHGTAIKPRLSVYRSNQHIYAQLIDDDKMITTVSATDMEFGKSVGTKTATAVAVGKALAKKAKSLKITTVCFDRGQYAFQGRVEAVAKGAREGGLKF